MQPPKPKTTPHKIPAAKPDLVLVHGFRGSPIGLGKIADFLRAGGYTVYIPAIPPFGGAGKLDLYTPQSYADFLANYIKAQKLDHPVLIGHSMGSIIVAATASFYPKIINRKTILLSPIVNRPAPPFRLVAPLSAVLPRQAVDYITTRYLFIPRNHALLRQVLQITGECSKDHAPKKSEVLSAANFSTHFAVSDFAPTQELFLLAGDEDRLVSKKQTIKLAHDLQAQLQFIPNCGHLHNYEKPAETAAAIIDFLED